MAESTVKIVFLGDSSKLKKELDDVDGSTSKAEGGFGKLGAAIGGALAVGSVVSLGKGAFDAAIESQKIAAQTEAAIKSTGAAAGITADEIGDMASALSKKNAVDDEAIQTGQNLLLTFTNIGKADKIFERTTQASIDMAAAMGTDVKSAAMQLGKALNDPADGLSKLSRAGIQFTDEQKKQIQTMQAAGDMAGAQAVMLGELERQFGGSAEAQATASDRMGIAFGNLQEQIGARLIPVMERFSAWVVEVGIPALERFAGWMQDNVVPAVQAMADGIGQAIAAVADWWGEHWDQIRETAATVIENVRAVIETVLGAIEAFWRTWGGTITAYLQGLWEGIRQVVEGALRIIQGVIDVVMGLIHGDFSRVWDGIRAIFSGVWEAINGLVDLAINEVRTIIETVMRLIAGVFDAAWEGIKSGTSTALGALVDFFTALPGRIIDAIGDIGGKVWAAISTGWDALKDNILKPIGDAIVSILTWFTNLPGQITGLVGKVSDAALGMGKAIVDGIKDGVSNLGSAAADFASAFASAVKNVVNTQVIDRINSALSFTIKGPGWLPDISIDPPDIPHLARGGITSGPMLAMIGDNPSGREAVIPLDSSGKPPWGSSGNTFIINVYGSRSPQATADTVQRTLMSNQLRVALAGA